MSIKQINAYLIVCDGCEDKYGPLFGMNAVEARATAFGNGWRFPSKVNSNGDAVTRANNDVCPICAPTFEPKQCWQAKKASR
jgi:hypothetical protein